MIRKNIFRRSGRCVWLHAARDFTCVLSLLCAALVGVACTAGDQTHAKTVPQHKSVAPTGKKLEVTRVPRLWRIGATEDVSMITLICEPDGRLSFEGGFEDWSPGRWTYDAVHAQLLLTLPKLSARDSALFAQNVSAWEMQSFNAADRTLVYTYTPATPHIDIAGYYFFPEIK